MHWATSYDSEHEGNLIKSDILVQTRFDVFIVQELWEDNKLSLQELESEVDLTKKSQVVNQRKLKVILPLCSLYQFREYE